MLFLFLILVAGNDMPPAMSVTTSPSPLLYKNCSESAGIYYAPNSTYRSNLKALGAALVAGANATGFATKTVGAAPDAVYGLAMCRGDYVGSDCTSSLAAAFRDASELLCPSYRDATVYYDQYMLRFSGDDFLSTLTNEPVSTIWNAEGVQGWEAAGVLSERVLKVMDATINYAAAAASRYATGGIWIGEQGVDTAYVLAQCTPDLGVAMCLSCLYDVCRKVPMTSIRAWLVTSQYGARVTGVRCNVRYEKYPFFVETNTTLKLNMLRGNERKSPVIKIVVTGVLLSVALLILGSLLAHRRIKASRMQKELKLCEKEIMSESDSGFSLYKFAEVKDATDNFSKRLGEGGFGPVFQGKSSNGQEIAVKRLALNSVQGLVEFKNEIRLIAKLQHINLVRLLGCCIEGNERMLVYEYLPKKSLDSLIFGSDAKLNWHARGHIIEGIAQGLLYLHEQSHLCVVHRDLKPSNILLDSEMNPKISDFGIARICLSNVAESDTTTVIGTIGYMAPEYFSQKIYSTKSDIFSFGVLVLEIISGKVGFGSYQIHGRSYNLRQYAWQLWSDERCEELIDPSLGEEYQKMEMIRCTQIALLCVQESAEDRPTMREVNVMLSNNNIRLPVPRQPGYFGISPSNTESSSTDPTSEYYTT